MERDVNIPMADKIKSIFKNIKEFIISNKYDKEAVIPLEKDTGWSRDIDSKVAERMLDSVIDLKPMTIKKEPLVLHAKKKMPFDRSEELVEDLKNKLDREVVLIPYWVEIISTGYEVMCCDDEGVIKWED